MKIGDWVKVDAKKFKWHGKIGIVVGIGTNCHIKVYSYEDDNPNIQDHGYSVYHPKFIKKIKVKSMKRTEMEQEAFEKAKEAVKLEELANKRIDYERNIRDWKEELDKARTHNLKAKEIERELGLTEKDKKELLK